MRNWVKLCLIFCLNNWFRYIVLRCNLFVIVVNESCFGYCFLIIWCIVSIFFENCWVFCLVVSLVIYCNWFLRLLMFLVWLIVVMMVVLLLNFVSWLFRISNIISVNCCVNKFDVFVCFIVLNWWVNYIENLVKLMLFSVFLILE